MSAPLYSGLCFRARTLLQICTTRSSHRYNHYMTRNRNILKLHDRGIFQNIFPEQRSHELHKILDKKQVVYCGFDPTANSLHVGHLLAIMALLHCQRGGHGALAVIGEATAQVGDPSGKTKERDTISKTTIVQNANSIQTSLSNIFKNHTDIFWKDDKSHLGFTKVLNNTEWYSEMTIIEFISTVGRYFRLGTMLGRHSVQTRMQNEEGMSFTEFSYQLLQAYDWWHLLKYYDCHIQIGGNDQTGNIMSGYDLITKTSDKSVWGLTVPLITSTTGDKLGKTAGNAVWLNADRTPPYELYQYFLRMPDSDVERYLKLFTFYSNEAISNIANKHKEKPELRYGQRKIAEEVTKLVHGAEGLASAERCTEALFNSSAQQLANLDEKDLEDLFRNTPITEMYLDPGTTVIDLVMAAHCFNRSVDAERVIKAGGVHINHQRADQAEYVLIPGQHILPNGITLIRIGKKNYYLVKWLESGMTPKERAR